jgi:hypothetical protein
MPALDEHHGNISRQWDGWACFRERRPHSLLLERRMSYSWSFFVCFILILCYSPVSSRPSHPYFISAPPDDPAPITRSFGIIPKPPEIQLAILEPSQPRHRSRAKFAEFKSRNAIPSQNLQPLPSCYIAQAPFHKALPTQKNRKTQQPPINSTPDLPTTSAARKVRIVPRVLTIRSSVLFPPPATRSLGNSPKS